MRSRYGSYLLARRLGDFRWLVIKLQYLRPGLNHRDVVLALTYATALITLIVLRFSRTFMGWLAIMVTPNRHFLV